MGHLDRRKAGRSGRRPRHRRIQPTLRIALFLSIRATLVGAARRLDQSAFLCHNTHRFAPGLNRTFIWLSPKVRAEGVKLPEGSTDRIQGRRNMIFPAVLKSSLARLMTVGLLSAVATGFAPAAASANGSGDQEGNTNGCHLSQGSGVKHVIYIQFDNTHFRRDNPNVPSDLEQMPNLLNFIKNNGTLDTNHHTPLISHTATDILTSLTGVYGDRHGVPVANSFKYFTPTGNARTGVSFAYWTAPIFDVSPGTPTDTTTNMLTAAGQNAPAPWVPYTRAGCDVGSVATANTILENTAIDIPTVFGPGPETAEVATDPGQAFADFVGIGIHCGAGGGICAANATNATNARSDKLPDEPNGY